MAYGGQRSANEMVGELEDLSRTFVRLLTSRGPLREVEDAVLQGLELSGEAVQQLSLQLESAQHRRGDEAAYFAEALEAAEQKLTFFLASTMRRSVATQLRGRDDAEAFAEDAERLAAEVCAAPALD